MRLTSLPWIISHRPWGIGHSLKIQKLGQVHMSGPAYVPGNRSESPASLGIPPSRRGVWMLSRQKCRYLAWGYRSLRGPVSRLVLRACGSFIHEKAKRLLICIPQVSTQSASAGCHRCHLCSPFVCEALENHANLNDSYFPNSVSMLTSLAKPWSSGKALLHEEERPGFLTSESV